VARLLPDAPVATISGWRGFRTTCFHVEWAARSSIMAAGIGTEISSKSKSSVGSS
jgi:hypothetical protein